MRPSLQKAFAWSGAAFVVLTFAGGIMAGLFPPPSPNDSAAHIASLWASHSDLKRVGIVIMVAASGVQVPFGALIAVRVRQMEGRHSPLTYVSIATVALLVMALFVPSMLYAVTSFRPERNPEITQTFSDFAWIVLVMNWEATALIAGALGLAVLGQRGRQVLPRWSGYYDLWTALLYAAGGFVVMFKAGVFAYNGLLAFWFVAAIFGSWYLVTAWLLYKSISSDDEESLTAVGSGTDS